MAADPATAAADADDKAFRLVWALVHSSWQSDARRGRELAAALQQAKAAAAGGAAGGGERARDLAYLEAASFFFFVPALFSPISLSCSLPLPLPLSLLLFPPSPPPLSLSPTHRLLLLCATRKKKKKHTGRRLEDGGPRPGEEAPLRHPRRHAGVTPGRRAQDRGRRPDRQGRARGYRDRGRGAGGAGLRAGDGVRVEEVKVWREEEEKKRDSFFSRSFVHFRFLFLLRARAASLVEGFILCVRFFPLVLRLYSCLRAVL